MPIREYECEDCGYQEEMLSLSKKEEAKVYRECPKCEGRMKRVISAPNHIIDGYSYKNLYGLKGDKNGKEKKPKDK